MSAQVMSRRLAQFRHHLQKTKCQAYVIPHNDSHFSEYLSERDERIAYISGFTGSNACAVITQNRALLWTDGRYFLQAPKEMSSEWELMRQGTDVTTIEWLQREGFERIGLDPWLQSHGEYVNWTTNHKLVLDTEIEMNLVLMFSPHCQLMAPILYSTECCRLMQYHFLTTCARMNM